MYTWYNFNYKISLLQDTGRFPAYKEIYAEYQWINAYDGTITRTRKLIMMIKQLSPLVKCMVIDVFGWLLLIELLKVKRYAWYIF